MENGAYPENTKVRFVGHGCRYGESATVLRPGSDSDPLNGWHSYWIRFDRDGHQMGAAHSELEPIGK